MEYVSPYGVSDPDAHYVDGDSTIGLQGSIPPAEAFEHPNRELAALIEGAGFTPTNDDLKQVLRAIRSQRINYAQDTGSVNALSVAYDPPFSELSIGLPLRVKVANTNTSAATISVDTFVNIPIKQADGTALGADDLVAGQVVHLKYDGTNFQIKNYVGFGSVTENDNTFPTKIPYAADTSVTTNLIQAAFQPAITSLNAGKLLLVKIARANIGNVTIAVNALPVVQVRSADLSQLEPNQLDAGMMALLKFDGTYFQLLNPVLPTVETSGVVQIVKRDVYQDPDYHQSTLAADVEAFRVSYVPAAAGNEVRTYVSGILNSGTPTSEQVKEKAVRAWIQYSVDNGLTWNPPVYPGTGFPNIGSYMALQGYLGLFREVGHDYFIEMDGRYMAVGYMTVPAGPPSNIIFRLMFAPTSSSSREARVNGGSIMEITEFTK